MLGPPAQSYALYLHSAGKANSRKGDGVLSQRAPASDEPCDIFVYDPEVPVLAPGGPAAQSGQFDQADAGAGQQSARLHDRRRCRSPCGFSARRGSRSIAPLRPRTRTSPPSWCACGRMARRNSSASASRGRVGYFAESGYAADTIHRWEFDLEPTSCAFAAGDRIRLEIASSAFPLYDRNPGSDVPSCRATSWDWQRSTQIVLSRVSDRSSALYLPREARAGRMSAKASVPQSRVRGRQQTLRQRRRGARRHRT